jgi:hypothetical protein
MQARTKFGDNRTKIVGDNGHFLLAALFFFSFFKNKILRTSTLGVRIKLYETNTIFYDTFIIDREGAG